MFFPVSFFFQFFKACKSSHSFRMRITNNSFSTMSSPVTVSLHSGSGSTRAPPLNTPASTPSQPVSLPDNNSLAQAISRALAELLPSLLSSLQDSSGGSTNIAATSGPLSSVSNSTQSQASLSPSTPCSTSSLQVVSSCALVYFNLQLLWGSLVVSTLPATSSANLPVVVGGLLWWHDRI